MPSTNGHGPKRAIL
jgi:DNA invertase Pin-like site-specific DNA recombinase